VSDHSAGKPLDKSTQQRIHAERMLACAERRSRRAAKLVDKWKLALPNLTALELPRSKRGCGQTNRREGSMPPSLSCHSPVPPLGHLESSAYAFLCPA